MATDAVLGMDVTELLKALQQDAAFATTMTGVVLDRCTVTVAASASEEAPSAAEAAARRHLRGAVTLRRLAAGVLAADKRAPAALAAAASEPYYLYVRVSPQAPQPGGEQSLGELAGRCREVEVGEVGARPSRAHCRPPRAQRARACTHATQPTSTTPPPRRAATRAAAAAMRLADVAYMHPPSTYSSAGAQASLRRFSSGDNPALAPWAVGGYRVLNGRPAQALLPVPLSLLVPMFGEFLDAAQRAVGQADAGVYLTAARLMTAMACDYARETDRNTELLLHLSNVFGEPYALSKTEVGGCTTDGTVVVNGAMVLNLELTHSGDPEMQNDCYLLRHTLRKGDGHMLAHVAAASPLAPAFLVDVHRGTLMVVRGAALVSPCVASAELAVASLVGAPRQRVARRTGTSAGGAAGGRGRAGEPGEGRAARRRSLPAGAVRPPRVRAAAAGGAAAPGRRRQR